MQTVGFIGAGAVATSVARLAVAGGLDVVLSNSRGPETLGELVERLGEPARAATPAEAAAAGDVVVLSIPLGGLPSVPANALAGKVVIDTTNYYPGRDGQIAELDSNELTASELVQRHLDRSRVVKAFNSILAHHIDTRARPNGAPDRSALPIAGNDAEAKATVIDLLDRLGYDAVDIGPLSESWRSEPNTPAYVMPFVGTLEGLTQDQAAERFSTHPGESAPAPEIKRLVAAATRGQAGGEWPSSE